MSIEGGIISNLKIYFSPDAGGGGSGGQSDAQKREEAEKQRRLDLMRDQMRRAAEKAEKSGVRTGGKGSKED